MKKNFLVLSLVTVLFMYSNQISAQSPKETINRMEQQQKLKKMNKELQEVSIDKETQKMAQQDSEAGWKVAPGLMSLAQQYNRSNLLQNQVEEDLLTPRFVWGGALSEGQNYDGAKMQAAELARLDLVESLQKNITKLVENKQGNIQGKPEESSSIISSIAKSKSLISVRLGQTIPVVETYREKPNGKIEVRMLVFYSMDKAREIARDAVRDQLRKEGKSIKEDTLDDYFNLK